MLLRASTAEVRYPSENSRRADLTQGVQRLYLATTCSNRSALGLTGLLSRAASASLTSCCKVVLSRAASTFALYAKLESIRTLKRIIFGPPV